MATSDDRTLTPPLRARRPRRLDDAVSPATVKSGFGAKAGGTFGLMARFGAPLYDHPGRGSRGCGRIITDPDLATATAGYYSAAELKESSK